MHNDYQNYRDALRDAAFADTIEEAEVLVDIVRSATGRAYKVIPVANNRYGSRRWYIRWMPQIGDGVCESINGDCYYIGEVTKVTKATFTAGSKVYRWSAKRQGYNPTGCKYFWANPGTKQDERRDPHF